MGIWKRIGYYMIGVVLGGFLVYFLFGDRDLQCSYFPNDRVLYELRQKELHYSDSVQNLVQAGRLDTATIQAAMERGDINFDKSDTRMEGCNTYWIKLTKPKPPQNFRFKNCDSTVTLQGVH